MDYPKLEKSFYIREDTLKIAEELLGKYLFTDIGAEGITGGMIVETEGYLGAADKASHGYGNRRTKRNRNLYNEGGNAYVYLCYGIYCLFNAVTGAENTADAVLIRAIQPETGIDIMLGRKMRKAEAAAKNKSNPSNYSGGGAPNTSSKINRLASGPGLLTIALGIDLRHDGIALCESGKSGAGIGKSAGAGGAADKLEIWLEDRNVVIPEKDIIRTARIGVAYAEEHASLPRRFKIKGNKWVSR